MKEITVSDLARWRSEGKAFVLLDVREPHEVAIASLPQSLSIPMRDLPQRLGDIPADTPVAVICHHGGRSEYAAQFLASRGFADVANVEGGIDAYARTVDPSIPRY